MTPRLSTATRVTPVLPWVTVTSMLLVVSACPADSGSTDDDTAGATEGSADGGSGTAGSESGGPEECPGVSDPECTTSAACGNGEICVTCECVPQPEGCDDPGAADCLEDSDCGDLEACFDCVCLPACDQEAGDECATHEHCGEGRFCIDPPGDEACFCDDFDPMCPEDALCAADSDCMKGDVCEDCVCITPCDCESDEQCTAPATCDGCDCVVDGEDDPVDDCTDDLGPVACNPQIDIVSVVLDCAGGTFTASVGYAATPLLPDPPALVQRELNFENEAGDAVLGVFSTAGNGPAAGCQLIDPGVGLFDLGPGDSCEINGDGSRFDFVLSADSLAFPEDPIATVTVFSSTTEDPGYNVDEAGPYDVECD